jgi:hypothetical protein
MVEIAMIPYLHVPHPVLTFGALLRCFGYGFAAESIVAMLRPNKQRPNQQWGFKVGATFHEVPASSL